MRCDRSVDGGEGKGGVFSATHARPIRSVVPRRCKFETDLRSILSHTRRLVPRAAQPQLVPWAQVYICAWRFRAGSEPIVRRGLSASTRSHNRRCHTMQLSPRLRRRKCDHYESASARAHGSTCTRHRIQRRIARMCGFKYPLVGTYICTPPKHQPSSAV